MGITFHANGDVTGTHAGRFGASGTVLQTVQGFSGTKTVTTTSANGDAIQCPASVSITPTSSSSKILIKMMQVFGY